MTGRDEYLLGGDLLVGAGSAAPRGVLVVELRDVGKLVASEAEKQGGTLGKVLAAAAHGGAPGAVEKKVLDEMAVEFRKQFAERGVAADVRVASTAPAGLAPRSDLLRGIAIGAGGLGLVGGLVMGLRYLFKRRSGS